MSPLFYILVILCKFCIMMGVICSKGINHEEIIDGVQEASTIGPEQKHKGLYNRNHLRLPHTWYVHVCTQQSTI